MNWKRQIEDFNKLHWTTRIFFIIIFTTLIFLNLSLSIKNEELNLKIEKHLNILNIFTLEDWIILYDFCEKKPWPKLSTIVRVYWDKQTDFKNYLLEKYEDD